MSFDVDRWIKGMTGSPGVLQTTPDNINQYYTHHWEVVFQNIPHVRFFCRKVTIPSINLNRVTMANPMAPTHFPGDAHDPQTFTMEFILDEDFKSYMEIYKWIKQQKPLDDTNTWDKDRALQWDAAVLLHTNKENANIKWTFHSCFPTNLSGIDLDFSQTDLSNFYLSAEFSYDYFTIENLS